jgi:hypothetical protein
LRVFVTTLIIDEGTFKVSYGRPYAVARSLADSGSLGRTLCTRVWIALAVIGVAFAAFVAAPPAQAASEDPLFLFSPPEAPVPPGESPPTPPPTGYLNDPCGLEVDSGGRLYVADDYHGAVDVFSSAFSYITQLAGVDDPCGLALDSTGNLYVNRYHGDVRKFSPSSFPPSALTTYSTGPLLSTTRPTGVATDLASDRIYVNERTHVAAYDFAGSPILGGGGQPLRIGEGTLSDGYGLAVSRFPGTAGYLYVPDTATDTVKVYDPATDLINPVATIGGPPGGFTSLRDSTVAVDRANGDVYVVDNLQPERAEQPEAIVEVFSSSGAHKGHLKYNIVHGAPTGLAVDNSAGATQGRVYVTSGNTHHGGIYVYPPGAVTIGAPRTPTIPSAPPGGGALDPTIEIGSAASAPGGIVCEGDACQSLPSEPVDPTLTTLHRGLGNPKMRYRRSKRRCPRGGRGKREAGRGCRRGKRRRARASAAPQMPIEARTGTGAEAGSAARTGSKAVLAAAPIDAGFAASAWDAHGGSASLAGSHPYGIELSFRLDQVGGEADLHELAFDLPPGVLLNPAALPLCQPEDFATPRSSPFETSQSGESCPDRTQLGTVEFEGAPGGGQPRRFGLFGLDPPSGVGARLGASPFGAPLLFDVQLRRGPDGSYALTLQASEVPQSLKAEALRLSLWGTPWDASHNTERGDCLNEAEPDFAWAKCSVGEPLDHRPLAFLTMPTQCGEPLAFAVRAVSWQGESLSAQALSRDEAGEPVPVSGCAQLGFVPGVEGLLSTGKASSASGFVFRFTNDDPGLADPRARIRSLVREVTVELPKGVTLNPSLGAGLIGCTSAQFEAESAFTPHGSGCPNGAKIGDFQIRTPFYEGFLRGGVYLAEPRRNPFGSLIAVYLIAKSADRGVLVKSAGRLIPDPRDGTLTATFEDLPELPYTDLELTVRSGQRAPLVSPPSCGPATTRITMTPWAGSGEALTEMTDSQIASGIDAGPCPNGSVPPFSPGVVAGGVNSNVGSYTPYFVHLIRRDTEQEITSYSLVLPKGIVGKLAGIPFCSDAAIAAARTRTGFEEIASPSCPAQSQVGRTLTGYGVGAALTYAPGRIYLAGPHNGQPLSLVTINPATVGPFDLGTVVVRSAFSVDPKTAQLAIDSRSSDPIPHMLEGIPLHLRDVRVYIDRPAFTRNPTSCEASELVSTLTGSGERFDDRGDDSTATLRAHFQLLNCLTLAFKPRLGLNLVGGTRRGDYPGLRAVFRARPADASLKRIAVTMPRALFLAQNHIGEVCTRVQFAAERCPPGSIYGRVSAHTPLFDEPLRGPVVLRSSDNQLPDLVALLRSGEVRIVLEGRIGSSQGGGIRAFFDELPDAPIERFTMWLRGGRQGLLVNSVNVCANPPAASVKALAQNNRGAIFTTELRGKCKHEEAKHRGDGKRGKRPGRGRGR